MTYCAYIVCRKRTETVQCVGRVRYFVQATLRPHARFAAAALELRPGDHLFAIVDAWVVEDVQHGIGKDDHRLPWAAAAGTALHKAGLTTSAGYIKQLLGRARESAQVFAMLTEGSAVQIRHASNTRGSSGSLARLAIPVTSRFGEYAAGRDSNWAVYPVVRVDRRKVDVSLGSGAVGTDGSAAGQAVKRLKKRRMYFVHTHANSNAYS